MDVRVSAPVDLGSILVEALAVHRVALKVANTDRSTAIALDNVHATIGDAAISARLGGAGSSRACVDAEVLADTTLTPLCCSELAHCPGVYY